MLESSLDDSHDVSFGGSSGDCIESECVDDDSLYMPTPERRVQVVVSKASPCHMPNEVCFMELRQLNKFIEEINCCVSCKTRGCEGNLVPVHVNSGGLGGSITVKYACSGCASKGAVFEASANYELGATTIIGMCVQVAFIIAGATHAVYYKTLQHALGIKAVSMPTFMKTIESMHPVVKAMLDNVCEAAKKEMKAKKDDELGSWNRAVTTADGTWQTRGWQSKNATFTIRNYLTGALLYYHHLCQKGRDKVVQEELYAGT